MLPPGAMRGRYPRKKSAYARGLKGKMFIKSMDVLSTALGLNTTPSFLPLNLLAEGVGVYQRLGRQVNLHSVHLKMMIKPVRTATVVDERIRMLLVYDRQGNGASPVAADLVRGRDSTGTATTSDPSLDHPNIDNESRFHILKDISIQLPTFTLTGVAVTNPDVDHAPIKIIKWNVPLYGRLTRYTDTTAAITSIAEGSLHLLSCGSAAAAAESCSLRCLSRLRFKDSAY